jgi:DNA helicase-2/ATP-dependent DNA helicase PcrA
VLDLGLQADESPFWNIFTGRGAAVLADFGAMLNGWGKNLDETPLPALFDRILTELGYQAYIQDGTEEGEDRWGNVQELRRLAYEYKERGLVVFLENLALVSDQDTLPEKPDAPTLLTLHAAKGLEFGRVFIVGLDEGLLPHSRSFDDVEEMAEERRLFYVGVTRAKDHLYLVRAERRSTYGQFEVNEASRFLEDLPDELVQHEGAVRPWKAGKTSGESWYGQKQQPRLERWQSNLRQGAGAGKAESSANMVQPRYRPAMRVRHAKWGEGMVVGSKVVDGEEEVDVMFSGVGLKRLLASLAVLEILNG